MYYDTIGYELVAVINGKVIDMPSKPSVDTYDEDWFRSRSEESSEGCWIWNGSKNVGGYAVMNRKLVPEKYVHRWAHICLIGPIPKGYQVDHLCKQPSCIRPSHLEAVSPRENFDRSDGPGKINALKTHCSNGHEFTEVNTYLNVKRNSRVCRTCYRLSHRKSARKTYNVKNPRLADDEIRSDAHNYLTN